MNVFISYRRDDSAVAAKLLHEELARHFGAEQMLPHVRDRVFPHFRRLAERSTGAGSQFAAFMKDAQLIIQKP